MHGLEVCFLTLFDIFSSLDFAVNRFLMKLFETGIRPMEIVEKNIVNK